MRVFRSLKEVPPDWGATVVSIGNFDGVHRAHQHVLARILERAKSLGAKSMAITFDPHPVKVLRPESAPGLITPLRQKLAALGRTGIDAVLVLSFDSDLASMSARDFAHDVLVKHLHVKEVHEGPSFHFGHRAEGNCSKLKEFGRQFEFEVVIYPEMRLRGEAVSSSRARQLLQDGRVSVVRHLLGRPFSILGTPATGRGWGSLYTVPTVNLAPYDGLVPKHGVYVTCTRVAGETFESITNVGIRPTFEGDAFAIETHLFDFHPISLRDDTEVEIVFLKWLRPEIKWPSAEALKVQIGKDIKRAKRFFELRSAIRAKENKNAATTPDTSQG